ncbi:MAG: DUF1273 family protein [Clostridia bacterium]|nr:DUF1273 family protein [Clostridia bacterium]
MIDEKQLFITTENEILKTCTFTGHRSLTEDFDYSKLETAVEELVKNGVDTFYNGMAIGFDLLAAETVLGLKARYPQIRLVACVPCYGQEKAFPETDKKRYVEILKRADENVVLAERYFRGCMQVRDRYMADRADVLVTYCKKETGGTAFTVRYFKNKYPQKPILFL